MAGYYDYGLNDLPVVIFVDYDEAERFPTKTFTEHHHADGETIHREALAYDLEPDSLIDQIRSSVRRGVYMVWIDVPVYRKSQKKEQSDESPGPHRLGAHPSAP